jgi:hypothetical protein
MLFHCFGEHAISMALHVAKDRRARELLITYAASKIIVDLTFAVYVRRATKKTRREKHVTSGLRIV